MSQSIATRWTNSIARVNYTFLNAGSQKARGIDLGAQYQIETGIGVFTAYTQATYLDSFEFAGVAGQREAEVSGETTDVFASNDGYLKWRARQKLDWTWNNININATLRYTGGFHEYTPFFKNSNPRGGLGEFDHYTSHSWMGDVQGSYEIAFAAPVESQPVPGFSKDGKDVVRGKDMAIAESSATQTANYGLPMWQRVLDKTTITIGCNNVTGEDPPKAFGGGGNSTGYPGFIYDATGRFVYVALTKKF